MPADPGILTAELIQAVELLDDALASKSIDYALVGGLATTLRGRPRFTQDVDLLLAVPQIKLPGLLDDLVQRGFSMDTAKVIREFVQHHLTTFRFGSIRIDWLKPVIPLYARALADASAMVWSDNTTVRVATAEGLILTKLAAFRPVDQADIEALLSANKDEIDLEIIRTEWSAVTGNEDARTAWFEAAVKRTVPTR